MAEGSNCSVMYRLEIIDSRFLIIKRSSTRTRNLIASPFHAFAFPQGENEPKRMGEIGVWQRFGTKWAIWLSDPISRSPKGGELRSYRCLIGFVILVPRLLLVLDRFRLQPCRGEPRHGWRTRLVSCHREMREDDSHCIPVSRPRSAASPPSDRGTSGC